jgi:mannose-6-phosphate isomerase-like protein (cupin superfamily)
MRIMVNNEKYGIIPDIQFQHLELIDVQEMISKSAKDWQNYTLCEVNESVVRLGVIHKEFHWHKHDNEDEFFLVLDGKLFIDLEDRTVELSPRQAFVIPKGVKHRTRAPVRTSILMIEKKGIKAIGD